MVSPVVLLVIALVGVQPAAVLDPADLSVAQSATPDLVAPGDFVTFTIAVDNAGPAAALEASLLDPLPDGAAFVSMSSSPVGSDWACLAPSLGSTGKISCAKKRFEPRDSVIFTVTLRVNSCAGNGALTNVVTVDSLNPDPNTDLNTAVSAPAVADPGTCEDGNSCTVGDRCAPSIAFTENFDGVTRPTLPPGWSSTMLVGPSSGAWKTDAQFWDTPPQGVFIRDASEVRDGVLDSPIIQVVTPTTRLFFMNRYDLEFSADGGVLEIKIGNGEFTDILDAGGLFESGGYDATIRAEQQNPLSGRAAWTGDSGGFRPTIVDLPVSAAGNPVVLRWRMATDRTLGKVGQWIDSVSVSGKDTCHSGSLTACDDNNACTADACDPIAGCQHVTASCDDRDACTDDRCDAILGCVHTSNAAACRDADACTADTCDSARGCVAPTANLDTSGFSAGRVDGLDLAAFAHAWNTCPSSGPDVAANLDLRSSCINDDDFHLFMNAFGRTCGP